MSNDLPSSTLPPQTLRFRLRERTENIHQRLDAELEAQGLMGNLDGYISVLKRFLGLYRPLERHLASIVWTDSGIDIGQRHKTLWLKLDLERLGLSDNDIARLPDCRSLPKITSIAEGLGVLYVLEGATLGGQIITRHIHGSLNIGNENGGRFFAAYGDKTGVMWREFVAVLDRHGHDEVAATAIEGTAVATFECFFAWMSSAPLAAGER